MWTGGGGGASLAASGASGAATAMVGVVAAWRPCGTASRAAAGGSRRATPNWTPAVRAMQARIAIAVHSRRIGQPPEEQGEQQHRHDLVSSHAARPRSSRGVKRGGRRRRGRRRCRRHATRQDVHLRDRRSLARHRPGALESAAAARRRGHCVLPRRRRAAGSPPSGRFSAAHGPNRDVTCRRRSTALGGRARRAAPKSTSYSTSPACCTTARRKPPRRALGGAAGRMMHVYAVNAVGPVVHAGARAVARQGRGRRQRVGARRLDWRAADRRLVELRRVEARRSRATRVTWRTSCGARTCPRWRCTPAATPPALPDRARRTCAASWQTAADGGDAPRGRRRPDAGGQRRSLFAYLRGPRVSDGHLPRRRAARAVRQRHVRRGVRLRRRVEYVRTRR